MSRPGAESSEAQPPDPQLSSPLLADPPPPEPPAKRPPNGWLTLALGPLCAALTYYAARAFGLPHAASATAGVTVWCALWWVLEPVPIPVTSIIPFAVFPLLGVLSHSQVATAYGHTLILLLLGGFVLSTAMEKSGAHRRIALGMVGLVGGGGRRLVLGFMLATALTSMWISNTATTLMMLPVALAVIERDTSGRLSAPLLLGIGYASSIGGLGTPVGTPPNVIFMGVYKQITGTEVSFLDWMKIGVPVTLILVPCAWLLLTRKLGSTAQLTMPKLGPWLKPEKRVLLVFSVTALLWITRTEPFGGWSALIGQEGVGDSTVALLMVVVMFVLPDGNGSRLLDWPTANRIPWGLLILFGGGIAIANAFEASGLSKALGGALSGVAGAPLLVTIGVLCLAVTFLTEVTSNTATATLLMPVLGAAAIAAGIDPKLLMVPAALSASCAFMLPVATAPNAIVFGTGQVPPARMAKEGFWLNLVGVCVVTLSCYALLR